MNNKTVAFHTLGCKVNSYDTEAMMEIFEKAGYRIVGFAEYADVYVVNTCTVTHLGDRKSRNMMRKARRTNPDAVIVAVGCYVQVAPDEVQAIEEVDLIIGTKNRADIVADIEAYQKDKTQNKEGCNQFCTYCIVPFARGPVRSRPVDAVLSEVKRVAAHGYAEVVLTGIHIASYGVDLGDGVDLLSLIRAVDKVEGVKRIRLGSLEPLLLTEEFVQGLSEVRAFCPHFHLSLQSGCDTVLSRMGRKYTTAQYAEIVKRVRRAFDYPAITTDIMVGFPGETEEEFEATLAFVEQIHFYQVHVFKYSRRKGTKADAFQGQVPEEIKTERSHRLTQRARACEQDFLKANAGRTVPVLYERAKEEGVYEGHTDNYIPVVLKTIEKMNGKIIETELLYKESEFHMTGLLN
ncbi:MiaB/RimO family radical SAM methylthiotransferase [Eubacterium callanderi]|uniref:MiaB/RimO family radical SAM methylthiotransferase n=1 Tax=Eubacterium callanderi TaxID=53442 RepID=UPI003983FB50